MTALRNTLSIISAEQYQVEVLSIYKSEKKYSSLFPDFVSYRELDQWRTDILCLKSIYSRLYDVEVIQQWLLNRHVRKSNYDAVIAYSDGRATHLVSNLRMHRKIAWVHTDVFSIYNRYSFRQKAVLNDLSKFQYIVTVSHFLKKQIQQRLLRNHNIRVLYNPIPIDHIRREAGHFIPKFSGKYLIAVGRLSYEKGMSILIDAYSLLPDHIKEQYPLLIVGDGPQKEHLIEQIRILNLESRIQLLGSIDNPYPYIKHASLVVVPSLFEGLGLVAIEAQVLGVPVVATRCGGLDEVLEHGEMGVLCDATKDSLACSIRKVLSNAAVSDSLVKKAYEGLRRFCSEDIIEFFESIKKCSLSFYANGPTGNHGCEALYYSLNQLFHIDQVFTLDDRDADSRLWENIDTCYMPIIRSNIKRFTYDWFMFRFMSLWNHPDYAFYLRLFRKFKCQINPGSIYASIGGDNYCYRASHWLYALNKIIKKKKGRMLLLGCSISPEDMDDMMICDLRKYGLIIARESITYKALVSKGIKNVELIPDPAFILRSRECELPSSFLLGMTVGINISPLIIKQLNDDSLVIRGIEEVVRYILEETHMNILFISHVVLPDNNDMTLMQKLYKKYLHTKRVSICPDLDCLSLKYIIGQCRFLIAARTHASIAAYSQSVPTLVLGYSVKAQGIARDLFGSSENYVLDIHKLKDKCEILNHFLWLVEHEEEIRRHYQQHLQQYIEPVFHMQDIIQHHFT